MELLEDDYLGGSGSRGSGKIAFRNLKVIFKSHEGITKIRQVTPVTPLAEGEWRCSVADSVARDANYQNQISDAIQA